MHGPSLRLATGRAGSATPSDTCDGVTLAPAGAVCDVELTGIRKQYEGVARPVIPELDLHVPARQMAVLVGPSGCGKSTTLRMVAGLEEPTGGRIRIDGRDVTE